MSTEMEFKRLAERSDKWGHPIAADTQAEEEIHFMHKTMTELAIWLVLFAAGCWALVQFGIVRW